MKNSKVTSTFTIFTQSTPNLVHSFGGWPDKCLLKIRQIGQKNMAATDQ